MSQCYLNGEIIPAVSNNNAPPALRTVPDSSGPEHDQQPVGSERSSSNETSIVPNLDNNSANLLDSNVMDLPLFKEEEQVESGISCRYCGELFSSTTEKDEKEVGSCKSCANLFGNRPISDDFSIIDSRSTSAGIFPKPIPIKQEVSYQYEQDEPNPFGGSNNTSDSSTQVQTSPTFKKPLSKTVVKANSAGRSPAPFQCKYCRAKFKEEAHAKGHSSMCFARFRIEKPSVTNFEFPVFPPLGVKSAAENQSPEPILQADDDDDENPPVLTPQVSPVKIVPKSTAATQDVTARTRMPCKYCQKPIELQHLYTHEKQHTEERPNTCKLCLKKFLSNWNLRRHIQANCCQPPISYTSTINIKSENVGESSLYKCPECPKVFVEMKRLKLHHRYHLDPLPYGCPECKSRFKSLGKLKLHKPGCSGPKTGDLVAVEGKPPLLVCPRCPVRFERPDLLKKHLAGHNDDKPLLCFECGQWFRFAQNLKQHFNTCVRITQA